MDEGGVDRSLCWETDGHVGQVRQCRLFTYDVALVKKLFNAVPERFINVVEGIEQFYDLKKLAFEDAVGRLKAYEERTR